MDRPISLRTIALRGGIATALSLASNWLLLAIVRSLDLVDPFDALTVPPVTFLTILGVLAATSVYAAITRISVRPDVLFTRVAVVGLLVSFVPDLMVLRFDAEANLEAVTVLMTMHVTVAIVCVVVLTGRHRTNAPRNRSR